MSVVELFFGVEFGIHEEGAYFGEGGIDKPWTCGEDGF